MRVEYDASIKPFIHTQTKRFINYQTLVAFRSSSAFLIYWLQGSWYNLCVCMYVGVA